MNVLFLKIINMSISASWIVLAVLILRIVLKKAPKWVSVLLWGIVAIRLICPFSFESALSLIPSAETIPLNIGMDTTPAIDSGISVINNAVNPIIRQSNTPAKGASINPLQIAVGILENIWILGVVALLLYTAISYWRLRRKVDTAVLYKDNIYQGENVSTPFVLGIIRPGIYLPFKLDGQNLEHVVAHEQAHIRRKDHWWKPLGFLLLAIHWFNPLMWVGYILLCRDIELACDEKVIKELGTEERADYSAALLFCSVNRHMISACPLAFGEVGVKERVKSIMNYRKPTFWIIMIAVVACACVAVCFLTNPLDSVDYLIFTGWSSDSQSPDQMNYEINLGNRAMSGEIYVEEWIKGSCIRSAPVGMNQLVDSIHITVRDRWEGSMTVGTDIHIETNQYGGSLTTYFPYPENYDGSAYHFARNKLNERIKLSPKKEVILEARSFQCADGVRPFTCEMLITNPEILETADYMIVIRAVFSDDPIGVTECISEHNYATTDGGAMIPMVMVDGVIYLDTKCESTVDGRCGVMDGEITSHVHGTEKPTIDNQSNFGTGYGYQYGAAEGTIEIYMDGKWWIFATEEVRQEIQFSLSTDDENEDHIIEGKSEAASPETLNPNDPTMWHDGISFDE